MEIKINELYELDGISWKHKYKEYKIHTHIDSISLCLVTYTRFLNKKNNNHSKHRRRRYSKIRCVRYKNNKKSFI